ncbi:uncharacterized protein RCC_10481 [Ramularia collo-cygni]|uniref:SnoaL-like domain-containing protein n=1 Tax=Ramularia collo-cygni TaxID=112498 RepID=A0A2D3V9P8_9PEZI|nr:uncharacterized protein RCC_10481 [Ramularia collo-cygni]CZT24753.1 uncharacterized protein RCC_10481 [Ramularia collo-cygni]
MSSPKTSWEERVKSHLEAWPLSMAEAINARDFDQKNPTWDMLAPGFKSGPLAGTSQMMFSSAAEHLKWVAQTCERFPDWKLHVLDAHAHIDGKTAVVMVNTASEGRFPGIAKETTVFIEFQVVGGRWLVTALKGLGDWWG